MTSVVAKKQSKKVQRTSVGVPLQNLHEGALNCRAISNTLFLLHLIALDLRTEAELRMSLCGSDRVNRHQTRPRVKMNIYDLDRAAQISVPFHGIPHNLMGAMTSIP